MAATARRTPILLLIAIFGASTTLTSHHNSNIVPGRSTIVHLFEWRWKDVARECEQFLGPYGYGGVQVSPPSENAIIWQPSWNQEVRRPWWERYQPVSYKVATRSGGEEEFRDMVQRCNNVGVRIYVDAVINHMTGHVGSGHGTGGSYFDPAIPKYEGVPYGPEHFNSRERCGTPSGNIENYYDKIQVRNCRLQGLADLDLGQDYVRNKVAEYLNKLISMGVAGFRIDAAKHMWPGDLQDIFSRLHDLPLDTFPPASRPFIFQEVIDLGGEPIKAEEYVHLGRVTEFRYGMKLGNVLRKHNNQRLKYLKNFGSDWGFVASNEAVVFVDNHDNQRGHGAGGFGSILTYFDARLYKMATAFLLSWPYGLSRVMSSYHWPRDIQGGKDKNDWVGPPHDDFNTKPVVVNADFTCGNGWVCEHRWRQIYNMVQFRNVVGSSPVENWWDNDYQQIAFSRGQRGFIAINNEDFPLNQRLHTGLPAGHYCDVISGRKDGTVCTSKRVDVDAAGFAQIFIDNKWEDPMIALHIDAKL